MDKLGEKVSYFRRSKGLTIKELAENICDDSTIYRLEKGKQLPRIEILNDICMKLEIPLKALFPFNAEVQKLKKLCREFTYTEDYLALELVLEECNKVKEELSSTFSKKEFKKHIDWHKSILLHKKENKLDDALNILKSLVNLENCTSELDINILNSTGLIYLSYNNVDDAYNIYKVIYRKIKTQHFLEDPTLLPRVGYNLANCMYRLKLYDESLKVCQEILYYIESNQLIYSLGEIYHMIGMLSKKKGNYTESKEAFNNAIIIFTLNKNETNLNRAKLDLSYLNVLLKDH
ncbi:helix-turn-helix domain-containing protein [Viridibacillus sp. FSL R5-0477]|uniref:Transcriptional regulator n=1 Tax=Viridibacillus arenosi FSL R5-213 TaxID=1227360 RepID=W4EM28_9BACL|nr:MULTISPECIES: helix-turn-helix domain-containing protein [Viridibacillus]ETT81062.1 transcriptional regulator [Viridibacillus arenosi FSL R5-213]OMC84015.1 transcriptional regulator [Viridibacillus sp. FSL H8-0123]OMC88538.1 transcriptional regulator [Viridibacillus sp. FSL H7-0596]OMC93173.1 transcriptional regulator [Viridibacillus arenosi]